MIRNIFFLVFTVTLTFSCSSVPVTGRNQLILFESSEMQAMSYQQYDDFLKEHKVVNGTADAQMIKKVGARIQKAVEAYMAEKGLSDKLAGFNWEFNLVEDDLVNAWCMPGGKVVFYTGILPVCKGEEGVAIVMGHEVAHAIARHGAERMSQQTVAQGLAQGVGVATMSKSPEYQAIFNTAFGAGTQLGMLSFSRQHESEADRIGLVFSSMAGYDPRVAPEFWKRMAEMSGGGAPPEFLSTHPSHDTRISDLTKQLPEAIKIYDQNKGKQ
ncbi:M48 family metallopeptidase [Flammeovirgaceae bacterium SG7u.111]|nr:M48 family metallopeptidase [Flammeovirgaceae bacterium SG7u.132]WPO36207.1 M48 family metallopeptidase [Flammeovirgaceae bacterium SG7u.111]